MLTPPGIGGHKPRRSRHRLRRTFGSLLVATLLAAAAGGGWWWIHRDGSTTTAGADTLATATCPPRQKPPPVVPAKTVRVNVFNATGRRGLAATVADQLRRRGFRVAKVTNDPAKRAVTGVAEVRASPAGAGPARTVAAQVYRYVAVPDDRRDASVDLVLGASFKALRPARAAAAAMTPGPSPRPSGC